MELMQKRWELLSKEVAELLEAHPELDPKVMQGLLFKVWDLNQQERRKENLWGVSIAKVASPQRIMPEELEELSPEEHALILASFRAVAMSSDEDE